MNIDLKDFERMTPQQKKDFQELLNAFPSMASKLDSARDLNTGVPKEPPKDENVIDFDFDSAPEPLPPTQVAPVELPTLTVGENSGFTQDPAIKEKEAQEQKKSIKADIERQARERYEQPPQPEPVATFKPEGKIHPIRAKLRVSLGMTPAGGTKRYEVDLAGVKYELRALTREEATAATRAAIMLSKDDAEFQNAMEECVVAFAIRNMDGVPVEEVFEIPTTMTTESGFKEDLPLIRRRELAAYALVDEVRNAPAEFVQTLIVYYNQQFPAVELLGKDKTRLYCPEAECTHQRIEELSAITDEKTFFCPYHGLALANEADLPNPF